MDESETSEHETTQSEEEFRGFGLDSIMRLSLSTPESVEGLRKQTEKLLGVWALFSKSSGALADEDNDSSRVPKSVNGGSSSRALPGNKEASAASKNAENSVATDGDQLNAQSAMFSTAESAMEAWALLATTMGGVSLVKSDYKKICFVENSKTDTQVAIWRDQRRKRLCVAFRGTEQSKWKDVITDLSLLATGFNPERVDGAGSRGEVLVHGDFLTAYDSVKARLLSLVRSSINIGLDDSDSDGPWHIYVTGHSLGGALATLVALDLASCNLAKDGRVQVTMYNYGSPRVGNRRFAEMYNKVLFAWRLTPSKIDSFLKQRVYCKLLQFSREEEFDHAHRLVTLFHLLF